MTDISDDQVNELLREAEERLARKGSLPSRNTVSSKEAQLKVQGNQDQNQPNQYSDDTDKKENLSVRVLQSKIGNQDTKTKDTAGPQWFNMPKTEMTPQFKRDWQLLRMRGLLDPKHQKKALHKNAPEYSQMGEIIAGPTEFYSARLTRKERRQTITEEVMSSNNAGKTRSKYAKIQQQKMSGKKAFYRKVVEQRRSRK